MISIGYVLQLYSVQVFIVMPTLLDFSASVQCYMYVHVYTSSFARFSYSECGLCSLCLLTHMGVMSSLASTTPSVAYARFARSLHGEAGR